MNIVSTFIKVFLTSFFIYLIYERIMNYKAKRINYIIVFFISIIISLIYIKLNNYFSSLINTVILYIIYAIIINKITIIQMNYMAYIYSCIIAYAIYLLAVIISATILFIILEEKKYETQISLIIIPIITALLFIAIFKTKRIKNGFNFLKKKTDNNNIKILTLFLTILIILIFIFSKNMNNIILYSCILICAILIMIILTIWIKSQITKTYKNRMRDRTIEIQKTEIDEQTKLIEEIKAENLKLGEVIHKYNKKFSSLEFAIKNALELNSKTEFAKEISVILKESEETLKNFAQETQLNTNKLPLTNITGIDNMFKYMQEEARKNNINFDLKINESIKPLMENTISKDKFETLIGDHLKDAIIAVNSSNDTYKSILVTLGLVEGIYELSIYDTGIEFEIDTLLKLGRERVTTHKQTGGSGIGFMTTFETLKECKASLVIEEYNPETTNYTKSVTIRFDGKNQYKICSYRAEKIKEQKPKRRIIIEEMK